VNLDSPSPRTQNAFKIERTERQKKGKNQHGKRENMRNKNKYKNKNEKTQNRK
jgi:hypothetical protein